METSTKIGLGTTAAGLVAGTGAGLKIGNKVSNKIITNAMQVGGLTKDEYINKKVASQVHNLKNYASLKNAEGGLNSEKGKIILGNIRKNATMKFEKFCKAPQAAYEKAAKSKTKWIKGMALAGLVLGAALGFVARNNTKHTTIKDGDTIVKISTEKSNAAKKAEAKKHAEAKKEAKAIKQAEAKAAKEAAKEAKAIEKAHNQAQAEAIKEVMKNV